MNELQAEVARMSDIAVGISRDRDPGSALDYSESSIATVEAIVAEAAQYADSMSPKQRDRFVQAFGCYILEVARRAYGGKYRWFEQRDQPVLVFGEPTCHIALLAWDKVDLRLNGDEADSLVFHFQGVSERARRKTPGEHVIIV